MLPTLLNVLRIPAAVTWPVSSAAAASIFTFVMAVQFRRRRANEANAAHERCFMWADISGVGSYTSGFVNNEIVTRSLGGFYF